MKTTKSRLVETQDVERDYGFAGMQAIVDTENHGRILIEDGFGGMDSLEGGCVRWKHGSAYQLKPGDTFESLDEVSFYHVDLPYTYLDAVVQQADDSRPWLPWDGKIVASIAKSLKL